ncbi:hypothetical protein LR48_Vigan07g132400 [Vigna angularis]|uniref:Uncharacterized protein n=1 Tax=Phaseolus angularis TaxID=3914 RepID=A0A0L9UXP2_PHAAN|nr:hypothetical protein LR48_Vigan07g132400 [Vigna angularis]
MKSVGVHGKVDAGNGDLNRKHTTDSFAFGVQRAIQRNGEYTAHAGPVAGSSVPECASNTTVVPLVIASDCLVLKAQIARSFNNALQAHSVLCSLHMTVRAQLVANRSVEASSKALSSFGADFDRLFGHIFDRPFGQGYGFEMKLMKEEKRDSDGIRKGHKKCKRTETASTAQRKLPLSGTLKDPLAPLRGRIGHALLPLSGMYR